MHMPTPQRASLQPPPSPNLPHHSPGMARPQRAAQAPGRKPMPHAQQEPQKCAYLAKARLTSSVEKKPSKVRCNCSRKCHASANVDNAGPDRPSAVTARSKVRRSTSPTDPSPTCAPCVHSSAASVYLLQISRVQSK